MTDQPTHDRDLARTTTDSSLTRPSIDGDEPDTVFATVVLDQTPTDVPPAATAPHSAAAGTSSPPRPTVRWGALVWSLLFAATAAATLWFLDPERRDAAATWLQALDPLEAVLYALAALGALIALFGLVGLLRRGERARRRPS